jgi:predicted transcriptional regulator
MENQSKTGPQRTRELTTMTISLPRDLKRELEERARAENRSVSNFVATFFFAHLDTLRDQRRDESK